MVLLEFKSSLKFNLIIVLVYVKIKVPRTPSISGPGARVMDMEFLAVSPAPCKMISCISPIFPVTGSRSNFSVVPIGAKSYSKSERIFGLRGQ